jgi:hypothetical protein
MFASSIVVGSWPSTVFKYFCKMLMWLFACFFRRFYNSGLCLSADSSKKVSIEKEDKASKR